MLLIAGASQGAAAAQVEQGLGNRLAGVIGETAMHVPIEIARAARATAREAAADGIVCIGGGSATGLAKAVALDVELPILAVPTTYAALPRWERRLRVAFDWTLDLLFPPDIVEFTIEPGPREQRKQDER